ncbi:P1 family peptidase [uncultured Hyphomonas sp.]|uniref:DmpA family aminopeptidase n=1 Tax=uncultured Hyphomonas sp. TaxID=225298 RepID=UPI002AAB4C7D|nr:P1 family peptidase [uncultured Hyphomonas sp.]
MQVAAQFTRYGLVLALSAICLTSTAACQTHPRARDIGIIFDGEPGTLNAITDLPGVEVGHVTLDEGRARTGATVVFPLGKDAKEGVSAAYFAFNGTGELTGAHFIEEFGAFFGPVTLTGTLGVGEARDGVLEWTAKHFDGDDDAKYSRVLPVVGETYDGGLNDAWSFPLTTQNVVDALESARSGAVEEGSVGGGTGMVAYGFKGGIGTSSRIVRYSEDAAFTVGVLVQANHGSRDQLVVDGIDVGKIIKDLQPVRPPKSDTERDGSIIILIGTDAPLLPGQLKRLARRAAIGMGRTGGQGDSLSGDIFLAFSTTNKVTLGASVPATYASLPNEALDPMFDAVVEATEEAILNALVAAEDMPGGRGGFVHEMPEDRVRAIVQSAKAQQ